MPNKEVSHFYLKKKKVFPTTRKEARESFPGIPERSVAERMVHPEP